MNFKKRVKAFTDKRKRKYEALSWHKASHKSLAIEETKEINPNTNPAKKKWPCKKNKGEHVWGDPQPFRIYTGAIGGYEKVCKACKKHKYFVENIG